MAKLDVSKTSLTNLQNIVKEYSVDTGHLDQTNDYSESYWDFPDANENLGYYKNIPELKKAVDALAMWVAGKGYETEITRTKLMLERISGMGEDSFEAIINNLIIQKKVFGDAFAEIIRGTEGRIENIKPLFTGNMRTIVNKKGIITRYEHHHGEEITKFNPNEILHLMNDRIANEIHGTSILESVKWVINARAEAMDDYRKVLHRNVIPVRIIEIDSENTTKRDLMIAEYEQAIKKGEVLVLPKGTAEIKDTTINIQDPIAWIKYLENYFYIAVGIPKVILGGSEEFTEASSKIAYLTFEQVYNKEQRELEADFWNQLGIKITFNKPASLKNELLQSEQKNTGQVSLDQQKETAITGGRE